MNEVDPMRVFTFQFINKEKVPGILTHEHDGGRSFVPIFPTRMLAEMELDQVREEMAHDTDIEKIDIIEIEIKRV